MRWSFSSFVVTVQAWDLIEGCLSVVIKKELLIGERK